jgi:hypothetical protein
MPPTRGDSRGPKNPSDAGRRRASWRMVLLGAALLACALALYWYGASNTPHNNNDAANINRATPSAPRPAPSSSPSSTPGAGGGGARPAR